MWGKKHRWHTEDIYDTSIVYVKMTILESIQSGSQFKTTDSLKVTLSISCKTGQMPGFISWAEWQIQYNASMRSEHFTLGPSMWPWFRWMSTSHLYSSNQQSFTETHAHTALTLSCFLCPLRSHYAAKTTERKKRKDRETADTGEIHSHVRLFTPRQQSESVILAAAVGCSLTLLFVHCQVGLEWQAPRLQTCSPPSPLLMQCRSGAECCCKRLQRSRMEAVTRKAERTSSSIRTGRTWRGRFILPHRIFTLQQKCIVEIMIIIVVIVMSYFIYSVGGNCSWTSGFDFGVNK